MAKKIWASALCWGCKHLNQKKPGTCAPFPEGIPHVIISNEIGHFENIKGDKGFKFEAIKAE
ncbi:MAG: hypothetical protein KAV87_65465 [Desulfobacteraceae bacterium]|nr:hypothetical protein [Desulfobacteraceae bacterium]